MSKVPFLCFPVYMEVKAALGGLPGTLCTTMTNLKLLENHSCFDSHHSNTSCPLTTHSRTSGRCINRLFPFLACMRVCVLSHVRCFVFPWTITRQAPLSMGFSRQEFWIALPFPSPGDLPYLDIEPISPVAPALVGGFFTTETPFKVCIYIYIYIYIYN